MKSEFALAFNEVLEEKGLPRDVIMHALESAMVSAYRKSVGASLAQDVQVKIDFDKGTVAVFVEKEVSDSILDPRTEVLLEEARKYDPTCEIGDLVMVESTPENFGRIAASTARQTIQQKIRDAERETQFEFFSKQVGEIVSGVVQAINSKQATIGLDMKAEGTMLWADMIPNERFHLHDRIRAYVYKVEETNKGLEILLSRSHRNFLRRLLENEVPEIYHGIVEIRSIAREAGKRAKVAVSATQMGIDPVGACVGQKGVRIQAIVRELNDEKIDVIEWSADPAVYISKALSPARVSGVYFNLGSSDDKTAIVVVPEDQLSLAIGMQGQNARLAAKLTGWRIDAVNIVEASQKALNRLFADPTLAELREKEADTISKVQEIIQKRQEGRALASDENVTLAHFLERVEKNGETNRKREAESAREDSRKAQRAGVDPRAFEINILDVAEIKSHIRVILQEAGIETLGDLMAQVKTDPDVILSYSGIGPKAFEDLVSLVESYAFAAEGEEAPGAAEAAEAVGEASAPEVPAAIQPAEAPEEIPAAVEPISEPELVPAEAGEPQEEKSFEELFKLETLKQAPVSSEPATEDEDKLPGVPGKKKGKKKKGYTVEYDPDRDSTVVRYKHKNDDTWEDW